MRGWFAIGAERISKPLNLGALMRTADAFGAHFVFSIGSPADLAVEEYSDTSRSAERLPYYAYTDYSELRLPEGCQLVGVELADDAVMLPSFRHPPKAAYILGPEKGSLSDSMLARCNFVVKIPTKFCINLSLAAALVMYDRHLTLGGHAPRPRLPGGPERERA
jgi:tRNA G18 (ribose-2'-O)-methylase SpoU